MQSRWQRQVHNMHPLIIVAAAAVGYGLYSKFTKGSKGGLAGLLGYTAGGNPVYQNVTAPANQAAVNPITGQVVPPGTPPFVTQVQTQSPAVPFAHTLHDWLKANKQPAPVAMVQAFQVTANSDPMAVALAGPLPTNGIFDVKTSAALTMYTGDPIVPDPAAPPPPAPTLAQTMDMSVPGNAAISSFNLYQYLKVHGNDKSKDEQVLVKQFQLDVNTDPKFPGPAATPGLPKIIMSKLQVNGNYDDATMKALALSDPDGKAPPV